jgi:CBS domain containing-hemolysin-like protein
MKIKSFKEKYEKKIKKIDKEKKKFVDIEWIFKITVTAFLISLFFSSVTESLVLGLNELVGILIVIVIILLGVIFDMIGVSVTAADLKPFNSMASKKIRGSKTAISLIKNAEKVSAFCNDVVGDVCGIISGSVGLLISTGISTKYNLNGSAITLIVTALIAAFTIGGKAMGKSYAINKCDVIIFKASKLISLFKKEYK